MEAVINKTRLLLVSGDITKQETDAIVNAANSGLMGGGGVDGAIHRAGGPAILEECKGIRSRIGRLPTGKAVITTGGKLRARFVIHTVGPVWHGGNRGEAELLASAYRESLGIAVSRGLKSISFPSISTGAFGYPVQVAAGLALKTVLDFLNHDSNLEEVVFVLFDSETLRAYERSLDRLLKNTAG
ncbi:MAG: O-acetyl-ADP-ribose deacetylase [Dehalococcoidia bacterium]|nr:O-acetyl-ADP-ribose deacetylase [Dehalococcoidia bacterium]